MKRAVWSLVCALLLTSTAYGLLKAYEVEPATASWSGKVDIRDATRFCKQLQDNSLVSPMHSKMHRTA